MNNQIKIAVSCAALVLTNSAHASEKKVQTYLGGQVGHNTLTADFKSTSATNVVETAANSKIGENSFVAGVHAGFDYKVSDEFKTGLDVSFNFTNPHAKHSNDTEGLAGRTVEGNKATLKQGNVINIAAKFAYQVQPVVAPYIKLGYSNAKFSAKSDVLDADANKKNISKTKRLGGLLIALGADVEMSDNMRLGFEYAHVRYAKFKFDHKTGNGNREFATRKFSPRTNTFMLRASYLI